MQHVSQPLSICTRTRKHTHTHTHMQNLAYGNLPRGPQTPAGLRQSKPLGPDPRCAGRGPPTLRSAPARASSHNLNKAVLPLCMSRPAQRVIQTTSSQRSKAKDCWRKPLAKRAAVVVVRNRTYQRCVYGCFFSWKTQQGKRRLAKTARGKSGGCFFCKNSNLPEMCLRVFFPWKKHVTTMIS